MIKSATVFFDGTNLMPSSSLNLQPNRSYVISIREETSAFADKGDAEEQIRHAQENPHPESGQWAEVGFDDWAEHLPEEDISELVEPGSGMEVHWVPGEGWHEADK